MSRFIIVMAMTCFITLTVSAQGNTPPTAAKTFSAEGITIALFSPTLKQGRAGVVGVSGDGIVAAEAEIFDQTIRFFALPGQDTFYGLMSARMEQAIRSYDMTITVTLANGQRKAVLVPLQVVSGEFQRQDVTLTDDLANLLEPAVEQQEFVLLDTLAAPITESRYWGDAGFVYPASGDLTSPFGLVRVFNGQLETRHTGWDFTGGMGDLLAAIADGRVVFAGNMDIRGGYVLIDHGYGVYSGYAHMSVLHVVQGQFVRQGQLLGLAGSTGRSSDPHLHIEMRVNNRWVDPVDFINMWVP